MIKDKDDIAWNCGRNELVIKKDGTAYFGPIGYAKRIYVDYEPVKKHEKISIGPFMFTKSRYYICRRWDEECTFVILSDGSVLKLGTYCKNNTNRFFRFKNKIDNAATFPYRYGLKSRKSMIFCSKVGDIMQYNIIGSTSIYGTIPLSKGSKCLHLHISSYSECTVFDGNVFHVFDPLDTSKITIIEKSDYVAMYLKYAEDDYIKHFKNQVLSYTKYGYILYHSINGPISIDGPKIEDIYDYHITCNNDVITFTLKHECKLPKIVQSYHDISVFAHELE
jgi:hypothetical protein